MTTATIPALLPLPHHSYIAAVETALLEAHIEPETTSVHEDQLVGHPLLRGRILLTPDTSGIPAARWPWGLYLEWEWHAGRDENVPRGASWYWAPAAAFAAEGYTESGWTELPVPGWCAPAMVAAAAATLAHTGTPTAMRSEWHGHLVAAAEDAIRAWERSQGGVS